MKRRRSNIKSTCTKVRPKQEDETIMLEGQFTEAGHKAKQHGNVPTIIPGCKGASNVFCCAAIGDAVSDAFCTDVTGAFPVMSLEGQH